MSGCPRISGFGRDIFGNLSANGATDCAILEVEVKRGTLNQNAIRSQHAQKGA